MKIKFKELWCVVIIIVLVICVQLWGSQKSLDVRLYYTLLEAQVFFQALTQTEVSAYIRHEFFDLIFIFTYSYLLHLILKRIYQSRFVNTAIATLPGFFDFIETTTILSILLGASSPPFWLGVITFLKWLSTLLVFSFIIGGYFFKKCLRRK